MLNGTMCATERALCCLVENYQTPDVCSSFFLRRKGLTLKLHLPSGSRYTRGTQAIYAGTGFPTMGEGVAKELAEKASVNVNLINEYLQRATR